MESAPLHTVVHPNPRTVRIRAVGCRTRQDCQTHYGRPESRTDRHSLSQTVIRREEIGMTQTDLILSHLQSGGSLTPFSEKKYAMTIAYLIGFSYMSFVELVGAPALSRGRSVLGTSLRYPRGPGAPLGSTRLVPFFIGG